MYKKYYSNFLKANEGLQHYACHSHHYWPDVTYDAMIEYWNDSAKMVDDKWSYILGTKVPETQKMISEILHFSHPNNICFASSTHDLIIRILSAFNITSNIKKIKILTTDSEFYSFSRQAQRLIDLDLAEVTMVPSFPHQDFTERFISEIQIHHYDLIFFSHVFFNSGVVVKNIKSIVDNVKDKNTVIVIDGYHGFMAIPTDLSEIQDRVFYIAGSYKYAQGGEGCCFMTIPQNTKLAPAFTGWFAGFHELEHGLEHKNENKEVTFSNDGYRFAGSTMDYTALYRLHAVLKLFKLDNITVEKTHQYVQDLQNQFLIDIEKLKHPYINKHNLISNDLHEHGHFYAFKMPSIEICQQVKKELSDQKIITDSRGNILRFGFATYQDTNIRFKY